LTTHSDQWAKSRLILHVGLPKTGTSAIQAVLRRRQKDMERAGLLFPVHYDRQGRDVGHSMAALALASGRRAQRVRGEAFFRKAARAVSRYGTVLVSSEDLSKYCSVDEGTSALGGFRGLQMDFHHGTAAYWERRRDYLQRLRDAIGEVPVEVWVTLRRQDALCTSIYKQAVRNRRYVGTALDLARSDFPLFDFHRGIGEWSRHFPVRVFIYEDSADRAGGIAEPFLEALGISDVVEPESVGRTNQAVHPDVIEACRRLNYFPLDKNDVWRRLQQWARRDPAARVEGAYDLLTAEESAAMMARYAAGNEEIRRSFSVDTPGRSTLFPDPVPGRRPVYGGMSQARFEEICLALALGEGIIH
jgi:hypothetical protein